MPNRNVVQRNGTVTFYIATADVPTSTTLYYTLEGSGITTDDFLDGLTTGSVTVSSGLVSFNKTIMPIGGAQKQFRCVVRNGSATGPVVMYSPWVTIPAASITISPPSVIYEDDLTYTWSVSFSGFASNTPRTLYWALSGTAATLDDVSALSGVLATRDLGSVALANSTISFSTTVLRDRTTEGAETLIPTIRLTSSTGTIVATGQTSTVTDSSLSPVVSADTTSVNEGDTITYTITLPDTTDTGTVVMGYTTEAVSGTISSADFVTALSGNVTFTNRVATLTQVLANDYATEGAESFRVGIRQRVDSTETVTMQALSASGYTLVKPNATIKSHAAWNGSTTYALSTDTYVVCPALGAGSYYVLSGSYATEATWDPITVYSGVGTGGTQLFAYSGTGTANYTSPANTTITIRFKSDSSTVGAGFSLSLLSYNVSNMPILAYGPTISVADTSTLPVVSVDTVVFEGSNFQFSVTGSDGTYYYTLGGGSAISADLSLNDSGSFVITGGTSGTITIPITADFLTEGAETFQVQVRSGSTSGTIIATSAFVGIADISTTSVSVSPTSYNEGGSITFNVTGPNGTLYYAISGTGVAAADFTDGLLSGSFTVTGNSGTITKTLVSDFTTEGTETFTLTVRSGSVSGTVLATASTITINDTSVYSLGVTGLTSGAIDEGGSITVTFGGPNGTYYYSFDGTNVNGNDITGGTTGTFTVTGNTGSFTKTITADSITEGAESFVVNIRTGSVSGTIISSSSSITINDTSLTPSGQNATATALYIAAPASAGTNLNSSISTLESFITQYSIPVNNQTVNTNVYNMSNAFAAITQYAEAYLPRPYTFVDTGIAGGTHRAGVLMDDGKVMLLPFSGTTLTAYDPATNTVSTLSATLPASGCAGGGLLLANGNIVLWPWGYNKVMVYNSATGTISTSTTSYNTSHTPAGAVLLPDGKVYIAPTDGLAASIYNPTTNTISMLSFTLPAGHVLGGVCLTYAVTSNNPLVWINATYEAANGTATTSSYIYDHEGAEILAGSHTSALTGTTITGAYVNPVWGGVNQKIWSAPRSYGASLRWYALNSTAVTTTTVAMNPTGAFSTTALNFNKAVMVPGSNDRFLLLLPTSTNGLFYRPVLMDTSFGNLRELSGLPGNNITSQNPGWLDAVVLLDGRILMLPESNTTGRLAIFTPVSRTLPDYFAKSSYYNS
jgi:hypothetical protein